MSEYRRIFVWEASIDLAVRVIALADTLVARKRFAIADQISRAAFSVPSNIAEGHGRLTARDRRHFFVQARGSPFELETQLEIITRARLASDLAELNVQIKQIASGLNRIIERLSRLAAKPIA